VSLYKGEVPGNGTLPNNKIFQQKIFNAVAAYLMICLYIASSVRSGTAQKRKDMPDAIRRTLSAKRLTTSEFIMQ
jgi:hypothetical protein